MFTRARTAAACLTAGCRLRGVVLPAIATCVLAGCGAAEYDQRLAETVQYFQYLEKLDGNLATAWKEEGVQLRVPLEFQLIPPPSRPKPKRAGGASRPEEEATPPPEIPDTRQPDYAGNRGELPGLLGAWQGTVEIDDREDPVPVWMYVVSNHQAWRTEGAEAASHFMEEATGAICQALGVYLPGPESNAWGTERFPRTKTYVESRPYQAVTIERDEPYRPGGAPLENVTYEVRLYWYHTPSEDIKVGLVFVVPHNIRPPRKETGVEVSLLERIELSLETLQVKDDPPSHGESGGRSGGAAGF